MRFVNSQEIAIFPNSRNMVKHSADLPSVKSEEKSRKKEKKSKEVKKEANKKEYCL